MNILRVQSLYFIKGLNYEGASFSILTNDSKRVTVFAEMCLSDVEPYAISTTIGNKLAAVFPDMPQQQINVKQIGEQLIKKYNTNSKKGVFVQIYNSIETDIMLISFDEISKINKTSNHRTTPKTTHNCERYILYHDNNGLITGMLQHEFDQELELFEREDANYLALYLLKSQHAFSSQKIDTSISISAGQGTIWLNHIKTYCTSETFVTSIDVDSMIGCFYSDSNMSDYIDGLLLMQSMGHNTKTSYAQFMSLWVVIEKIIHKSFKSLSNRQIYEISRKNISLLNNRTVNYIKQCDNMSVDNIDKTKFNILDKFLISTLEAGLTLDNKTIDLFKQIKRTRDGLHSSISEDGSYPKESILHILRKLCD